MLAIDQKLKEDKGSKTVVAKDTATLELTPQQSEVIVQAQHVQSKQLATISLALRSIADSKPTQRTGLILRRKKRNGLQLVKYGVTTRVSTSK